jgi:tetratricopeptide (TPR) repeat protein
MKTLLTVFMLLAAATFAGAQDRLADQLRKGIVLEEVNQNLPKAIEAYQAIVAQFDEERKTAASAIYRLAECARKTGKRELALAAYSRVVREFPDQAALAASSRQQLTTAIGSAAAAGIERGYAVGGAVPARERARESLQREKAALEERLKAMEQRIKAGMLSQDNKEYQQLQKELDQAARQLEVTGANLKSFESQEKMRQLLEQLSRERTTGSVDATVESTRLELAAAEKRVADQQKKVQAGLVTQESLRALATEYELARLRYEQQLTRRDAEKRAERDAQMMAQGMIKSVEAEIALIQERLTAIEKSAPPGTIRPATDPELLQLKRDLLSLQRKLDELRSSLKR